MININFCLSFFTFWQCVKSQKKNSGKTVSCTSILLHRYVFERESRQIVMNFPNPKCCHNQIKDCCHSIPPRLPILLLLLLIDTLIVMLLFLMIYGVQSKYREGERENIVIYLQKLYLSTLLRLFFLVTYQYIYNFSSKISFF